VHIEHPTMENGVQLHPKQARPLVSVRRMGTKGRKTTGTGGTKWGRRGARWQFILIRCEAGRAAAAACGIWQSLGGGVGTVCVPPAQHGQPASHSTGEEKGQ